MTRTAPRPSIADQPMSSTVMFGRFADMGGVDRGMGLAAQGFTALIPLLIVVAAVVAGGNGGSFGDRIVHKLDLSGASAAAARQAFPESGAVEQSVTDLSTLLLLI